VTVAEAQTLARPETFDAYQKVGEHYSGIRRWSPAFLAAFEFESVPTSASLMRAIEVLREVNSMGASVLPKSAPSGSSASAGRLTCCPAEKSTAATMNFACCQNCATVCSPGEVWVTVSRRHRSFEERLVSKETVQELLEAGTVPIAVEADFDKFIESRRALLDKRMVAVDARARDGLLLGVTITKGALKIAPTEKSSLKDWNGFVLKPAIGPASNHLVERDIFWHPTDPPDRQRNQRFGSHNRRVECPPRGAASRKRAGLGSRRLL
jgi:hypothetical protein